MVQGSLIVIQECLIEVATKTSDWMEGPLVLSVIDSNGVETRTGEAERLTYFSNRIASALYPLGRRKWRQVENGFLEVLLPSTSVPNATHLFALHIPLSENYDTASVVEVVLQFTKDMPSKVASAISIEASRIQVIRSYYMISGVIDEFADALLPTQYDNHWSLADQYAWRLSTLINGEFGNSPPIDEIAELRKSGSKISLTNDQVVIVAHDGCSFVGVSRTVNRDNPFASWVEGNAALDDSGLAIVELEWHSIFLDSFFLGILQRSGLNRIADEFAGLTSHEPTVSEMLRLERSFAEFKAAIWRHQITEERAANQILRAFQREHALDDLLAELGRDLSHYSGQIQTLSVAQSSAALTLLSITLIPITVILYILQSIIPSKSGDLLRIGVFLLSVPISLLFAFILASFIPGYLKLLRDILRHTKKGRR